MAEASLQTSAGGRLETLRNRHRWIQRTLEELRDQGVTAEMLSASGAKWPALQAKYGTDALVRFGYTWPIMLQSGFTSRNFSQLTHEQLTHLGVNAVRAMECRPRVADICALQLSSTQLASMGWTQELLSSTGLNMQNMVGFGYALSAWKSHLGVDDYAALGFSSYSSCAAAGWHDADIRLALNAHASSAASASSASRASRASRAASASSASSAPRLGPARSGELRFI